MAPEIVAQITQEVMRQINSQQQERGRKRTKNANGKEVKRRRDRSQSPSRESGTDSNSSGSRSSDSENEEDDDDNDDDDNDDVIKGNLVSAPLALQIDTKIKNKIWQDKYVDFGKLLPNDVTTISQEIQLQSVGKAEFKLTTK